MRWLLPTPLLLFVGVMALWSLAFVLRRSTSALRPLVEAFVCRGAETGCPVCQGANVASLGAQAAALRAAA